MKQFKFILAVFAFGFFLSSCCNRNTEQQKNDPFTPPSIPPSPVTAIGDYLGTEIGKLLASGDVCIPMCCVVFTDKSDSSDILVWGDWWVFNYNLVGDTLKTISGGNYPGLFHVRKIGDEYTVISFEQVEDGAGYEASARRIFGEHYDVFQKMNSDSERREINRSFDIASYLEKHQDIRATYYQDYGWPAVEIPVESYLE